MKLTDTQLDEIEQAAKKAHDEVGTPWAKSDIFVSDGWGSDVADYLATMDPATMLALIAELKDQRAVIERVRSMHQPVEPLDDDDSSDPMPCTCGHWNAQQCPDRLALGEEA